MKSGKQRRREIKEARRKLAEKQSARRARVKVVSCNTAPCNPELLAPNHSCSDPLFVLCGYYRDMLFRCRDCGTEEVWSATRQKWWYEVGKGDVWTTAIRCNACRRKERERKSTARKTHLDGIARKKQPQA